MKQSQDGTNVSKGFSAPIIPVKKGFSVPVIQDKSVNIKPTVTIQPPAPQKKK